MRKIVTGVLVFLLVFGLVSYTAFAFSPQGMRKKCVESECLRVRGISIPPGLVDKGGLPPGIKKKIDNDDLLPPGFKKKEGNLPPGIIKRFNPEGIKRTQKNISTEDKEIKDVEFTRLSWNQLPDEVKKWVEDNRYNKSGYKGVLKSDKKYYILVCYGEKPTGGYKVTINSITLKENKDGKFLEAAVELASPKDGDLVITAFTYPYDLIVVEKDCEELFNYPVEFVFTEADN